MGGRRAWRRGRERPGVQGDDSGPRPGDTEPAAPGGRRRRARARRRERAAKSSCLSANRLPPHSEKPAGPTPSAAEQSGAGSYNSACPPDPLPGSGRGAAAGAPAAGEPEARPPEGARGEGGPRAPTGQRGGGEEGVRGGDRGRGRIPAEEGRGEGREPGRRPANGGKCPPGNKGLARGGAGRGDGRGAGTPRKGAAGAG